MSYHKAMKHARNVRKCRAQSRMHFGFSTLDRNERRKEPWFGSWTQSATQEEIKTAYDAYYAETARILAINPQIILV